jgi:hypothetical protein
MKPYHFNGLVALAMVVGSLGVPLNSTNVSILTTPINGTVLDTVLNGWPGKAGVGSIIEGSWGTGNAIKPKVLQPRDDNPHNPFLAIQTSIAKVHPKQWEDGMTCYADCKSIPANNATCYYHRLSPAVNRDMDVRFIVDGWGNWFSDKGGLFSDMIRDANPEFPQDYQFSYFTGGTMNMGRAQFIVRWHPYTEEKIEEAIWNGGKRFQEAIEDVKCKQIDRVEQLPVPPVGEPSENRASQFGKTVDEQTGVTTWTMIAKGPWVADQGKFLTEKFADSIPVGNYEVTVMAGDWIHLSVVHVVANSKLFQPSKVSAFFMNMAVYAASAKTGTLRGQWTDENPFPALPPPPCL